MLRHMLKHVLMSEIEIITDGDRRRRWTAAKKLRTVEETLDGQSSISVVARRNGVVPNLLYRWRRLMLEGRSVAVTEDDDVTRNHVVREMESRIRELERPLGRKTLEAEILREALGQVTLKNPTLLVRSPRERAISSEGGGRKAGSFPLQLSCLVAEHHWDEVSWTIAEHAWRFEPVLAELT